MATYQPMKADRFKAAYPVVKLPGKFKLQVSSVSANAVENPNLKGQFHHIVNLKGVLPTQITDALKEELASGEVEISNHNFMSFNIPVGLPLPGKGEYVDVTVGKVFSKRADAEVLGIVAITIPVATSVSASGWDEFVTKEGTEEDIFAKAGADEPPVSRKK